MMVGREPHQQLVDLMKHLPGMAYRCRNDKCWTMEYLCGGVVGLLGYQAEDLVENRTTAYADLIHPDDRDRVWSVIQRCVQAETPFTLDYRIRTKLGVQKHVCERGWVKERAGDQVVLEGYITDISTILKLLESLRESTERYRTLVENANDAVYMHEIEERRPGRILDVNECACRMLGYSRTELLRMHIPDIDTPEQKAQSPGILRRLRTHGVALFRAEHVAKDGRHIPVEVSVRRFSLHGKVVALSTARDVSDRDRFTRVLRSQAKRNRALLQLHSLHDSAADKLADATINACVEATGSQFGFVGTLDESDASMSVMAWSDTVKHLRDLDGVSTRFPLKGAGRWAEPIRTGQPMIVDDVAIYGPDEKGLPAGHLELKNLLGVPVLEHGQTVAVVCLANKPSGYTSEDVTTTRVLMESFWQMRQRRRGEQALQESEERFRLLFESHVDAVFVTTLEGRVLQVNVAAMRQTGFSGSELVGRNFFTDLGADGVTEGLGSGARPKRPGDAVRFEELRRRKDGSTYWSECTLSALQVDGEGLVVAVSRDVTERRAAEERLEFLSTRDPVTGAYNRVFFGEEMRRLEREQSAPTSVVIADVNGLKATNDEEGHAAGDDLLRSAYAAFHTALPKGAIAARIGGDEFAALLPGMGEGEAQHVVLRIRKRIQEANKTATKKRPIGLAVGAATAASGAGLPEALRLADARMYEDKRLCNGNGESARRGRPLLFGDDS